MGGRFGALVVSAANAGRRRWCALLAPVAWSSASTATNRTVDHPRTRCNARRDERPLRRRAKDKRSTRVITARRVLNVPKASNDAGVGAHEQQKWHTGRLRSPHRWPRETL